MKSYKETSDSVIRRINEERALKAERAKKIKNSIIIATSCICAVVLLFTGAWQLGLFQKDDYSVSKVEISNRDSKYKGDAEEILEELKTTTEPTTKPTETTTEKTTDNENTTEKEENFREDMIPSIQINPTFNMGEPYGTNKHHPEEFKEIESATLYSNGEKGKYESSYLEDILSILNHYINDGTTKKINSEVTKETIDEIRKYGTAIDIDFKVYEYESEQEILITFDDETSRTEQFDEVLLILEGKNAGFMYFLIDGECWRGEPIKITNTKCLKEILEIKRPKLFKNNLISNWVK